MVPFALNQKVNFIKNKGPKLEKFNFKKFINNDKTSFSQKLHQFIKQLKLQETN